MARTTNYDDGLAAFTHELPFYTWQDRVNRRPDSVVFRAEGAGGGNVYVPGFATTLINCYEDGNDDHCYDDGYNDYYDFDDDFDDLQDHEYYNYYYYVDVATT